MITDTKGILRFTRGRKCPVCGDHADDDRGQGRRCVCRRPTSFTGWLDSLADRQERSGRPDSVRRSLGMEEGGSR
jgi:hypothetical protein